MTEDEITKTLSDFYKNINIIGSKPENNKSVTDEEMTAYIERLGFDVISVKRENDLVHIEVKLKGSENVKK